MHTKQEWAEIYDELQGKLHVPCVLKFSTKVKIGRHQFNDDGTCSITINPEIDFRRPEHLILHEMAHHRNTAPYAERMQQVQRVLEAIDNVADIDSLMDTKFSCCTGFWGHCEHWATMLVEMYKEAGVILPLSTRFEKFAEVAGIICKAFEEEKEQS